VPLPGLGVGNSNPGLIIGIDALAPRDVLAEVWSVNNSPHTILLRWNGSAWKRIAFPYAAGIPTPLVPDGHGGIWFTVDTGNPPVLSLWFVHDSGGQWTKTAVPSWHGEQPDIFYMSSIPGTRSIWATGDLADSGVGEAILKYGP